MFGCRALSNRVALPQESVFAALADFGSFAQWMPGVTHSRILAQEGDIVVAEFIWPALFQEQKFVLEFVNTPPKSVLYAQTAQYRQKGLSGRWDLAPAQDGGGTVLTGEMRLWTGWRQVWSNRQKLRHTLAQSLDAVGQRALALANQPELRKESGTRTNVLKVVKHPDGLDVCFFGDVYRLSKRPESGPS